MSTTKFEFRKTLKHWALLCATRRRRIGREAVVLFGATSVVLALSPRPSSADNQNDAPLQEIIVTAQKREERLQEVPISVTVLSGSALDQSAETIMDELGRVPGVVTQPPGSGTGGTQIAIRGVAASGGSFDGASPIAYYLDGVPFGFIRNAFVPDASPFDLQRVEVLRGPQGTLYGAGAENGVVRVLTNDADPSGFDFKARVRGSDTDGGGANGAGDVAVNVPIIDGKLAVRAVLGYQDWSGWIDRPNDNDANKQQQRNYRLKLNYQPLNDLTIDLTYWGSQVHSDAPPASDVYRSAMATGTSAEPVDNDFDAYAARIAYQASHLTVTSTTSNLDYRSRSDQALAPYGGDFFAPLNAHSYQAARVLSEELLLNSVDTGPWRWTAGAMYRDESDPYVQQVYSDGDLIGLGYFSYLDRSRSEAIFGELSRKFLDDKLEWTLGLRQFHDDESHLKTDPAPPPYYQSESFDATTPRAILSWYPGKSLTIYSSFSEGYRSGLASQQYFQVQSNANLPGVKPDKLYDYELGAKADLLEHRLLIDTSVYYIKWKDVQQPIAIPYLSGYTDAVINGQSASGPGVDFAVTAHPMDHLEIGGTLSWSGLRIDSAVYSGGALLFPKGARLNDSSERTAGLFANYTAPLGGSGTTGELSVSGNYTAGQPLYGITFGGAGFVSYGDNLTFVRAAFAVHFQNNWSVKLYGDNLTNEYGALAGVAPGTSTADPTQEFTSRPRPRTIGLELNYRYK